MTGGAVKIVEVYINGVWTDITSYVRLTDAAITIKRGRQDEAAAPQGSQCNLVLNNADGRFSPRNTAGAYYPYLGKNTPIAVLVSNDANVGKTRFWGYVSNWPVEWDETSKLVNVTVTADGPRRRMLRDNSLPSPYRLAMNSQTNLMAYWPLEDGHTATSFGGVVGNAGAFTGAHVSLAADSSWAASMPLPTMGDLSEFQFTPPAFTPSVSGLEVRWLASVADPTATGHGWTMQVSTRFAHMFEVDYFPNSDKYQLKMISETGGTTEYDSGLIGPWGDGAGTQVRVQLFLKQNGTGIDWSITTLKPGATTGVTAGATITLSTLYPLTDISIFNGTGLITTIGHLSVENHANSIYDLVQVLDGYAGELAMDRVSRLCSLAGVTYIGHDSGASAVLGPQGLANPLALIDEAMATDGGISTEGVGTVGIEATDLQSLYSTGAGLTLAHTDCKFINPVDDDQVLVNDVTVTRPGGSSATAVATAIGFSPAEIGEYQQTYTLNLFDDTSLAGQAALRLAIGTVNAPRVPALTVDLRKCTSAQRDAMFELREGLVVVLTGAPAFSGLANPARLQIVGWDEILDYTRWQITFHLVPEEPYNVFILDDDVYGILDENVLG